MKSFLLFFVGGLLFGAISLGVGYTVWGDDALVQGGAAFGLTFIPATITLVAVLRSYRANPEMQLLASLGGSGARMAVALGGAILLRSADAEKFDAAILYWLLLFYLGLLGFEITLVVWQQPTVDRTPQQKTTV